MKRIHPWHGFLLLLALGTGALASISNAGTVASAEEIINALLTRTRAFKVAPADNDPPPAVNLDIPFDNNSDRLQPDATTHLDALAEALSSEALASSRVEIVGHTDSSGSAAYNLRLSQKRAESVRQYLVEKKSIDPTRLVPVGRGESEPRPDAAPGDRRNRRVEIRLLNPN